MDGLTLRALVHEWNRALTSSRIEKIHQPNERELVFTLRHRNGTVRMLLSAHKEYARAHLLHKTRSTNPLEPPMFCMRIRKHLEAGRILKFRQHGWDRVLEIVIQSMNELGDPQIYVLICEFMGKHSNILLCTANADETPLRIVDAIVHVNAEMSRVRQVYPGALYQPAPPQNKKTFAELTIEDLQNVDFGQADARQWINKANALAIIRAVAGFGPSSAREALYRTSQAIDSSSHTQLLKQLQILGSYAENDQELPSVALDQLGRPEACAPFSLRSFHAWRSTPSMSEALDQMYEGMVVRTQQSHLAQEMSMVIEQHLDRLRGKLTKIRDQEVDSGTHDQLRLYGDLLTTYAYQVQKGQVEIELPSFEDDTQQVLIKLDPALTPIENAQRYYRQSAKRKRSIAILATERQDTEADLHYLEDVKIHLQNANLAHLQEIRTELELQGFLKVKNVAFEKKNKSRSGKVKTKKSVQIPQGKPEAYLSSDKFVIYVGRNNLQNDRLTLRSSQPQDIWFHVKDQPGSHVVIRVPQGPVPETTLADAALLAVYYSKARDSANVAVDYTEIRHIWKPNGARPGHVLYDHQKTLYVTPDRTLIQPILDRQITNEPLES